MWTPTIALLPGALMIYLGFDGGGYFPPATGAACVALAIALVLRLTGRDAIAITRRHGPPRARIAVPGQARIR